MGPDAAVILPELSDADRIALTALIASRATFQSDNQFTVAVPPAAEEPGPGESLSFEMSVSKVSETLEASDDEVGSERVREFRRWFRDEFGFESAAGVDFFAARNLKASHRVLAELCLAVAERFGGIIDFGGALHPRRYDLYSIEADWDTVRPHADKMLAGMPGKLVALPYQTARDTTWVSHYGDAAFLRAWLTHPRFHMIK
jgi:hypothetical protein